MSQATTKPTREQLLERAVSILEKQQGQPEPETTIGFCLCCGHEQACFSNDPEAGLCESCKQASVFEANTLIHIMTSGGDGQ